MGDEKKPGFLVRLIGAPEKEEEKSIDANTILKKGAVTDFKKEQIKYNLIIDSMQAGVEANYYWILRFMTSRNLSFGLGMEVKIIPSKVIFNPRNQPQGIRISIYNGIFYR